MFIFIDYIRLHIGSVKKLFLLLFGQLLRRNELHSLTGGSYLLLASLVAIIIFSDGVFMATILFLVIGDTVAALIGLRFGKTRLFRKTVAGTLACLISCLIVAYVLSQLPNKTLLLPVGIIGACFASLVEALPVEVNDNVIIPILSGAVMQLSKLFF